jgi:peptidoglycan/xylan/chitin deacetylase (PgdA/CDA1 family)
MPTKEFGDNLRSRSQQPIQAVASDALFLTFDDGPDPDVTPAILDVLDLHGHKATFFVTGESLRKPGMVDIVVDAARRGHTIGNHGSVHDPLACPRFDVLSDVLERSAGVRSSFVRAPYGRRSLLTRHLRVQPSALPIHWTYAVGDWQALDLSSSFSALQPMLTPGSIILLHDGAIVSAKYRDRRQTIDITAWVSSFCASQGLPLAPLADVYPGMYECL